MQNYITYYIMQYTSLWLKMVRGLSRGTRAWEKDYVGKVKGRQKNFRRGFGKMINHYIHIFVGILLMAFWVLPVDVLHFKREPKKDSSKSNVVCCLNDS